MDAMDNQILWQLIYNFYIVTYTVSHESKAIGDLSYLVKHEKM
jgi:hypothetical protein